jgi:(4S)-4-hydroxy-5-phosphonooxypentane-2,3-dione isomerase
VFQILPFIRKSSIILACSYTATHACSSLTTDTGNSYPLATDTGKLLMLIVHVQVHVNAESVGDFIEATIENARNSIREPGIARFDVVQQTDDPTRFVLVEVYRDEAATKAHKETAHYAKWRDTVGPMMQEPRSSTKFSNLFPADA